MWLCVVPYSRCRGGHVGCSAALRADSRRCAVGLTRPCWKGPRRRAGLVLRRTQQAIQVVQEWWARRWWGAAMSSRVVPWRAWTAAPRWLGWVACKAATVRSQQACHHSGSTLVVDGRNPLLLLHYPSTTPRLWPARALRGPSASAASWVRTGGPATGRRASSGCKARTQRKGRDGLSDRCKRGKGRWVMARLGHVESAESVRWQQRIDAAVVRSLVAVSDGTRAGTGR